MIKEKRRRQRRRKKLLIGILIFLLLAVIAAFIVVKVFVVKTVKVEGNKLYDEQLITETVLNDEYSWNSLYVWLKYTFIDTMEIKLNSPSSLTIKVYEKGMMGYLHISSIDQMAYFDKDGFVVETSTRVIENVPKIDGLDCEEVVLFEKLPIGNQQLRDMLTLTQTLRREGLEPDGIRYGTMYSPVLYYGNTEVWMGSTELLTQKVERLNEILPSILEMEGILHMENWTEETANIIFQKTEAEEGEDGTGEDGTDDGTDRTGDAGEGADDAGNEAGDAENGADSRDDVTQDTAGRSPESDDETPNADDTDEN